MISLLKAVWFWVAGVTVTFVLFLACAVRQLIVILRGESRDGHGLHQIATLWGRSMIWITPGWRIRVEGRENLPKDRQPVVIVANHESMCDIFALYFLGVQFRWMAKEAVFKVPMVGQAMTWAGYVPVRRGNVDSHRQAMEKSSERIHQGVPMLFFPEGTRSTDGKVKAFKSGAFRLAREHQVPVLPIAIHGAADMLPKGSGRPGPSLVHIRVLPQVPPPAPGASDLDAYSEEIRQRIIAAHAELV